jgi:hypothetical protein
MKRDSLGTLARHAALLLLRMLQIRMRMPPLLRMLQMRMRMRMPTPLQMLMWVRMPPPLLMLMWVRMPPPLLLLEVMCMVRRRRCG